MAIDAIGLFRGPEAALEAAGRLRAEGFAALELISPIPLEGVEHRLGTKQSVIKRFTFFGALFGGLLGFALAAGTAVLYPHPVGGRPIIPIPPYLVIAYEMTILGGILATVVGFLISARLPVIRERAYVSEASVDRFVVTVACADAGEAHRATAMLRAAGAEVVEAALGRAGPA
jgi:hypothetical protein